MFIYYVSFSFLMSELTILSFLLCLPYYVFTLIFCFLNFFLLFEFTVFCKFHNLKVQYFVISVLCMAVFHIYRIFLLSGFVCIWFVAYFFYFVCNVYTYIYFFSFRVFISIVFCMCEDVIYLQHIISS